jgi:glucose-1-phosphate thymidylyltransferase
MPKHLFPVANRPILFHNLEALRASGVHEAAILVEPPCTEAIAHAVGDGRDWDMALTVAEWGPSAGLRGALASAHRFLGDEPVLVQRGDAVLRDRLEAHFSMFERECLDLLALRLTKDVKRTSRAPAPGYLFSSRAVSMLLDRPHGAGSPIADVRAQGGRVRVQHVDGELPCHGDQDTLLASNRALLGRLRTSFEPQSIDDCTIQGPVEIHPTARVRQATLRGPLIIGPRASVTGAYIGPYTSIGADVEIEGAEIEHSIVLPEAQLRFVGTRVESSIIGRGARIARSFQPPGAFRLTIGEGAEVVFA